ncbi:hypothetical protein VP01_717g3 [Puccinia sorghi]|uniref:Uncharacterized protein n=1 Tax=Puccinia sorghi TaxID=27349 RepID=A0A0L6UFJ0_9BASI|nr:hypothetical protein VP01_717g3 [Puccinia sorghi]
MGLQLRWEGEQQVARVAEEQEATMIDGESGRYLRELAGVAQEVSERHLVSSLVAGPDNEADDSLDLPLFLGPAPSPPHRVVPWVLAQLGLPPLDPSALTFREPFPDQQQSLPTTEQQQQQQQHQEPWVLTRLAAAQPDLAIQDTHQLARLQQLIVGLRPRLSLEITLPTHPTKPLCLLLGPLPIPLRPWAGLISYRVAS